MYNIYCEEKKLNELNKKERKEKELIINKKRHKEKTQNLFDNYQKRIKKFMIDVRIYNNNYIF